DNLAVVDRISISRLAIGLFVLLSGCSLAAVAQGSPATTSQQRETEDPTLAHRRPPKPKSQITPEGKIKLDVVVDDGAGKPVQGLEPWDFKILDNNQPRPVRSFRA